jgi:hypothetical protein
VSTVSVDLNPDAADPGICGAIIAIEYKREALELMAADLPPLDVLLHRGSFKEDDIRDLSDFFPG